MATYKVRSGGKVYNFEGPDGLPIDAVKMLASDYFNLMQEPEAPPAPVKKPETGFIPSIKRGAAQTGVLLGDILPAMAGRAVGADEYAAQQMQEAAKSQEEIAKKYPAEVPSYTDIKDVSDALVYAKEAVGEALPSLIPSLFTGGTAAILGRGAVAAAQATAEKAVLAQAAKGLAGEELKQAATQAGIQAARQTALKYEAGGALAGSAAQNIPDVYQNIYEATGQQDLGTAIAFGSFNAVLDAALPISLLRKAKLSGIGPEELGAAWYKRAGTGVAKGFVTEGGTEALQEVSSAAAENFVDQNLGFFTPQNFERFINAGLKGGLGGAGITGVADVVLGKGPEAAAEAQKIQTKGLADVEVPADAELGVEPELAPTTVQRDVSGFEIAPEGIAPVVVPTGAPATQLDVLIADFDKRAAEIKALEQKQRDGTITSREQGLLSGKRNKQRNVEYKIKTLQTAQEGAPDVGPTDTTAGGTSVPVAGQPDTVVPTEGLAEPDGLGVVPVRPDAVQPIAGEKQPPITVNQLPIDADIEDFPSVHPITGEKIELEDVPSFEAPKTVQPKPLDTIEYFEKRDELIAQMDKESEEGSALLDKILELNSVRADSVLGDDGKPLVFDENGQYDPDKRYEAVKALEAKYDESTARFEAIIKQIDELDAARQALKGDQVGTETPEAVETETQGQEAPTAEPTVEVTPEQQEMYEDTREYHKRF